MARHYTCDRCGQPIPTGERVEVAISTGPARFDEPRDLCRTCGDRLAAWLRATPVRAADADPPA